MKKNLLATLLCSVGALTVSTLQIQAKDSETVPPPMEKSILWVSSDGRGMKTYTDRAKEQFQKVGWKFEEGTPEQVAQGNYAVYFFSNLNDKVSEAYSSAWPILWKKVKDGAILILQPQINTQFGKFTDDETLDCRIHGIEKIAVKERKAACLPGDWLKKPFDLQKEFQRCVTPAYTAIPQNPEMWQTLATQPKSGLEQNVRTPFILFRPYGKGFVVVIGEVNIGTFSLGVFTANLYENRETLRGKSL